MSLPIGSKAPDFVLFDQNGAPHALKDELGKWVLLFFYPKDNTPGCTKEACTISDAMPDFSQLDVTVFGISTDSVKSHKKFEEKQALKMTLLADEEKKVVEAYGVWGPKKFMGREFLGTKRVSFLIDPQGNVAKIYENVKPAVHAAEVLADVKSLQS